MITVKNNEIPGDLSFPWIDYRISKELEKDIKDIGIKKIFKKNQYFIRQGEKASSIYLLDKGGIKISTLSKEGEEKIFWFTFDGNIINDVPFFHHQVTKASIIAIEDCICYELDKEKVDYLLKNNIDFVYYITNMFCEKIRILTTRIISLSFLSSEQAVSQHLFFMGVNYGKDVDGRIVCSKKVNQSDIALVTSLHRVTVTKIINKLISEKIIEYDKDRNINILEYIKLKEKAFNL
ncbi:Crp/Fnr family transcriptional regulator [Miniphocaeibacter massiliensis]|uniref:Crp/Fnr family transcriptional regulator n=1 Tax=Miniphocaeibacter massiliensis TaxID=2041841 RepID=UPI000C1C616B|nr:Crp/Fnr family transcriptional regulator [Miniphocaeibacter massiliensis]